MTRIESRNQFHSFIDQSYEKIIQARKDKEDGKTVEGLNSPYIRKIELLKKYKDQFPHVYFESPDTWFCCTERQLKMYEKEAIDEESKNG